MVEIHNGIMLDIYSGLPHMQKQRRRFYHMVNVYLGRHKRGRDPNDLQDFSCIDCPSVQALNVAKQKCTACCSGQKICRLCCFDRDLPSAKHSHNKIFIGLRLLSFLHTASKILDGAKAWK